jgi:hypothetical protein
MEFSRTRRKRENREGDSDFRSKVSEKHTNMLLSSITEKDERDRPATPGKGPRS